MRVYIAILVVRANKQRLFSFFVLTWPVSRGFSSSCGNAHCRGRRGVRVGFRVWGWWPRKCDAMRSSGWAFWWWARVRGFGCWVAGCWVGGLGFSAHLFLKGKGFRENARHGEASDDVVTCRRSWRYGCRGGVVVVACARVAVLVELWLRALGGRAWRKVRGEVRVRRTTAAEHRPTMAILRIGIYAFYRRLR